MWIFIHKLLMLLNVIHDILLLKEATGNLLPLFSLLFVFLGETEMKFLLWSSEAQLELSITYLGISKWFSPPADGQKPFASGFQTISTTYVLLLAPNYTDNCSAWCCMKCGQGELPPAPREGHRSPDSRRLRAFCVLIETLLGLEAEGVLPCCTRGHPGE